MGISSAPRKEWGGESSSLPPRWLWLRLLTHSEGARSFPHPDQRRRPRRNAQKQGAAGVTGISLVKFTAAVWSLVSIKKLRAFLGFFQGQNHRWPSHLNLRKPSKNHRCQWLICKKTFNGDGPGMVKPLKNHRWQWCLGKKTLPSHRYKKVTIVEV